MKVVKASRKQIRSVTLRLPEKLMESVDRIAARNDMSRQELIAAILNQAINDERFVLKVEN